ncbi:hypothetical protein DWW69_09620 [Bacteroides sp. AF16-49]|nr:hypothetical protein DWW69_09620 [Bacteroides sp. AF16-49]
MSKTNYRKLKRIRKKITAEVNMEANKLREELLARAIKAEACKDGITDLSQATTKEEIAQCFIEYLDFCLAKDYPDNTFLKRYLRKELENIGIYIDRDISFKNRQRTVLLGDCRANMLFDGYTVSRIWVKHTSRLSISACKNAIVMIDALDTANVDISTSDDSVVIVNLYGKATCKGATKIMRKGETYELQIR